MGCAGRLLILGVMGVLASIYFGYQEMRYTMGAEVTSGTVEMIQTEERRGRRGRRRQVDVCHFVYDTPEGPRSGKCDMNGATVRSGQQVEVEYIPGTETARLKGMSEWGFVGFLGGGGLLALMFGMMMARGSTA